MTDNEAPELSELFDRLADDLGEVVIDRSAGRAAYARAGSDFATADGAAVEIRLEPEVAEAVLRTPDTAASRRGAGWVRLEPPTVDRFVVDRAEAWFRSAWRFAERSGPGPG